jgi:hypothetical protein
VMRVGVERLVGKNVGKKGLRRGEMSERAWRAWRGKVGLLLLFVVVIVVATENDIFAETYIPNYSLQRGGSRFTL